MPVVVRDCVLAVLTSRVLLLPLRMYALQGAFLPHEVALAAIFACCRFRVPLRRLSEGSLWRKGVTEKIDPWQEGDRCVSLSPSLTVALPE